MNFRVTTEGENCLNIRELCQAHVDSLWVPTHLSPQEAAVSVLDHFKRTVLELELLAIEVEGRHVLQQRRDRYEHSDDQS